MWTLFKKACIGISGALLTSTVHAQHVYDRFGNTYTLDQIEMSPPSQFLGGGGGGGCIQAGIFNLSYDAGSGFSPVAQQVVCQVFSDLSELIEPANNPYTGAANTAPYVNIRIVDFALLGAPLNVVAAASPIYSWFDTPQDEPNLHSVHDDYRPLDLMNGVLDGQVWKAINGGYDPWFCARIFKVANTPPALAHGILAVNWSAPNPWHLGTSLPAPAGERDLYTVIAHEALHMLGFGSTMDMNLLSLIGNTQYVSRFDTHLNQAGNPMVIDPVLCDAADWSTNFNSAFNTEPGNCSIEYSGTWTTPNMPIYGPLPFEPGSSLSHVDGACTSNSVLMHPDNDYATVQSRVPLQSEVNMLCDIDYRTRDHQGTSGSGWDGTFYTRTPCGSRLAGVDDIWSDYASKAYYQVQQGGTIMIENFLDNDEDMATLSGHPVAFSCLEVLEGGTITTQFNFPDLNPRFTLDIDAGFVGWARVSYRPRNAVDGRTGNITNIYIHVWPSSACANADCNILNGGDLEGVAFRNGNVAPHDSYTEGSTNSPDLFAFEPNGFPLSTIGPRPPGWYDFNSLTAPSHFFGLCGGIGEANPSSWNGAPANMRYAQVICVPTQANTSREGLLFETCKPLMPGYTYTIEYRAKNSGSCASNWSFYAFKDRPCNQTQGITSFTTPNPCGGAPPPYLFPLAAAPLTNSWAAISNTFVYSAAFQSNYVVARSPVPSVISYLLIDDLVLRPVITADATITPACNGQSNGSIALDVHYYPGSYSILWNTGATTATLSNLAAGTYSVTITDNELGCATFTESYVVGAANCSGPFTLTKWVTPNNPANTYAGAPVMFTIQTCNNDAVDQVVDITDEMPAGFVPAFNNPNNPYWPTASVTIPAGQCVTTEITGYFTEIGPHTNTVTLEQDPGISLSADATVTLLQGCPMLVSGNGGCQPDDPVNLCLGMHTQLTDVGSIDYYIIYPDFLEPPAPGSIMGVITSPFPIASATIGTPTGLSWPPGYSAVPVHVAFSAPVSPSPPYWFFCIGFTVGTVGVPPGVNAVWTWASTTPSVSGWNRVTVNMTGGSTDLWTQAYHILFTGCPDINVPNANFTAQTSSCGGTVTVSAELTDPDAIHIWTWGDERTTPINGAPGWTYDYFGPITDNQGWPVNIPPAAPGTYTITHTVVVDGVASTSTQAITLHACCPAALAIPAGKYSSAYGSIVSGTVDIQGQFIIDQDFTFSNAQVTTEPGAEIIVQPGRNFNVFNSTIESCQGVMWKGITAGDGSIVQVNDSHLADAESGWTGMNSSILLVSGSELKNNRTDISVPAIPGVDFNSVSIYVTNSVFHAEGPLAQPYPGQTSVLGQQGYAALDVNNMNLNFTGQANEIHHLSNGIVARRCNVGLANCNMHDIQPDAAYAYTGNGAGIYARGDHGFFSLKQSGYGTSNVAAASFTNCRWGIYSEYMNVYSTANRMVDMGTAYRVDKSGYRKVNITGNKLDTRFNGIDLRFNDGASQVLVADNDITFGSLQHEVTKGYTAINVQEGNAANPSSVIQGNIIHYRHGSLYAANGIALLSASDYNVLGNTLLMDNNAVNRMGIIAAGCRRHLISCNDVHGSASNYGVYEGQSAIRNNMGDRAALFCNTVDGTTNGIYFSGPCYGTDLSGNSIKRHQWGLHLDNNAIIEAQDFKGNLWYNAPVGGGVGAWYENTINAGTFHFLYSPAMINGGNTQPPSWAPLNWFSAHSGTNYQCGYEQSGYCGHAVREYCESCATGLDQKIAADSLANDPYTKETKWVMKSNLYGKLDNDPSLAATDQELADFYSDMQGTAAAQFKLINDDYLALFHLDSTVLNYLIQNRVQLDTLMDQLKLALAGMENTSLTINERLALYATIGGLQQNISSLTALTSQALALADSSRVLTAEGVKTTNATIATSELIESNEKQMNEVYLGTVAKGIDGFTAEQATTLFSIANQCPLVGGNAVYRARAMYALIDDEQNYDDPALCLQHGLIYRSMQQVGGQAITVVPNPATDHASLILDQEWDAPGVFIMYDAMGAVVLRAEVPAHTQRWEFSTAALVPAIYHYRVRGPSGGVSDGKLSIIR